MWNQNPSFGGDGGNFGPGGGFQPNTQFGSPSIEGTTKRKGSNLIPCTIAHLHKIPEDRDHLLIGTTEAASITIVGRVISIEEGGTKITFQLDDLTGPPIEVHFWLEGQKTSQRSAFSENTYVRVIGNIRCLNNKKKNVLAHRVLPLKDLNELTIHLLEVVKVHMALKAAPSKENLNGSTLMDTSEPNYTRNDNATGTQLESTMVGMTKAQKLVFQSILSCKNEGGIGLDTLNSNLKTLTPLVIKDVIEFLCNEGHIYSTIDEEHFRATEAN